MKINWDRWRWLQCLVVPKSWIFNFVHHQKVFKKKKKSGNGPIQIHQKKKKKKVDWIFRKSSDVKFSAAQINRKKTETQTPTLGVKFYQRWGWMGDRPIQWPRFVADNCRVSLSVIMIFRYIIICGRGYWYLRLSERKRMKNLGLNQ